LLHNLRGSVLLHILPHFFFIPTLLPEKPQTRIFCNYRTF
jgi:hypothetical protein